MLAPPQHPRNLEASFRDLDSEKPDTRVSSIADLTRHARGDDAVRTRAIPLLEKRLDDPQSRVRAAAAVALGDLVAEEAVPALLRAVDDDDAYVRQMALNTLGELHDERALPRLEKALRDERAEMRYQAIIAYARVEKDSKKIGQALLDATNDDDDAVVHIALRVAEERLDAGESSDERLLPRARALLKSESPHLSLVAAIFLGKAGDEAGNALLLRVVRGDKVANQPPEKEDERAAVELVGQLGLEAATRDLERRAWGVMHFLKDTCPFHAKIALARMGHPRAIDEIMKDLDSNRPDILAPAVVAAGRARLRKARPLLERITSVAVDPEAFVREALELLSKSDAESDKESKDPS